MKFVPHATNSVRFDKINNLSSLSGYKTDKYYKYMKLRCISTLTTNIIKERNVVPTLFSTFAHLVSLFHRSINA